MKHVRVVGTFIEHGRAQLGVHDFWITNGGQLGHAIDGIERATVPPEGWDAYLDAYPQAEPVVAELRGAAAAPVYVKVYGPGENPPA